MAEEFETDIEITKVYEGTSGEGEFGPWTAYNFYVKGDDRKFSWFKSDSKPIMPVPGMLVKLMEYFIAETYSEKHNKTFTNYNVSRIILHGDAHKQAETFEPPHKPVSMPTKSTPKRDNSLTMYISYAKDIVVAQMAQGGYKGTSTLDISNVVVDNGVRMYDRANREVIPEPQTENTTDTVRVEGDSDDRFPPIESYMADPEDHPGRD